MKGYIYLSIKATIDAYQVNFNKSIEVYKELVLSTVDDFNGQCVYFMNALSIYVRSYGDFGKKQVKSLMQFHESLYKKVPEFKSHDFFGLTYYEFMFFSKCSEMEKAKLKLHALSKLVKVDLELIQNQIFSQNAG